MGTSLPNLLRGICVGEEDDFAPIFGGRRERRFFFQQVLDFFPPQADLAITEKGALGWVHDGDALETVDE